MARYACDVEEGDGTKGSRVVRYVGICVGIASGEKGGQERKSTRLMDCSN